MGKIQSFGRKSELSSLSRGEGACEEAFVSDALIEVFFKYLFCWDCDDVSLIAPVSAWGMLVFFYFMVRWHSKRSRMKVGFGSFQWFVTTTRWSEQCAYDAHLATDASCVRAFRFLATGAAAYETVFLFRSFWFRSFKFWIVLRCTLFWWGRVIRWDWRRRYYCITLIPLFPVSCVMFVPCPVWWWLFFFLNENFDTWFSRRLILIHVYPRMCSNWMYEGVSSALLLLLIGSCWFSREKTRNRPPLLFTQCCVKRRYHNMCNDGPKGIIITLQKRSKSNSQYQK